MKKLWSYHFCVKVVSALSGVSWLLLRFLLWGTGEVSLSISVALMASVSTVLLLPVAGESAGFSLAFSVCHATVLLVLAAVLRNPAGAVPVMMLSVLAYLAFRLVRKYGQVRCLYKTDQVWKAVEENSRWLYSSVFFVCAGLLTAGLPGRPVWPECILALLLYVALLVKSYLGRTFIMSGRKEDLIVAVGRGTVRPVPAPSDDEQESARMGRLYDKVTALMENKKPYLDEEFSLQDMGAMVFSNKTYLSKTINVYSGRNFRQFINYYRVLYSIELMKKDPHLRVTELAAMSGFHSVVTYNMAFKLNMNETPSEYMIKVKLSRR